MKKINYFSGMAVRPDDLMEGQAYFEKRIDTNMHTIGIKGVVLGASTQEGVLLQAPYVWTDTNSLGVYGLEAYDSYGRFIYVEPKFSESGDKLPTISNLTPDENGKLIEEGSGSFGYNKQYLMVIRYAELKDKDSERVSKAGAGKDLKQPTRIIPSFELYIREDSDALVPGDVVLATIYTDSTGVVSADESTRDVFSLKTDLLKAKMGSESGAQALGSDITFEDHINMTGSGSVSRSNPHGMSAEDLGIDISATGKHQLYLHSDGIKTDDVKSTSSALYPSYFSSTMTSEEKVYVEPLSDLNNEIVVVNGGTITPANISDRFVVDMQNYASDENEGYYVIAVNGETKNIEMFGPFNSDTSEQFLTFIGSRDTFPICSFHWGKPFYVYYTLKVQNTRDNSEKILANVPSTREYYDVNNSGSKIKVADLYVKKIDEEGMISGSLIRLSEEDKDTYWVTEKTNQLQDSDRFDIDPLTFKDRRVFNNTGFKDIRREDLAAIRDSAPFANNDLTLYYARIESSEQLSYFKVGGEYINMTIDGNPFTYQFVGVQELSIEQLLSQLNGEFSTVASDVKPKAYINHNKHLTIVASKSLELHSGSANEQLGFKTGTSDDGEDIKTLIYTGDMDSVQEMYYNENDELNKVYYITAGNKLRSHSIEYSGDFVSKVTETVEDY